MTYNYYKKYKKYKTKYKNLQKAGKYNIIFHISGPQISSKTTLKLLRN